MSDNKLTVLFGTMTGNAEDLAISIQNRANEVGVKNELRDLADYPAKSLAEESEVVIVISTWGEGDPPGEAEEFYESIMDQSYDLSPLKYSVVALGDSSYDDFCGCGRKLDERLTELGAQRAFDRVELDIDFEDGFEDWLEKYTEYIQS